MAHSIAFYRGRCQDNQEENCFGLESVHLYSVLIVFLFVQACMAGIVFAKFTKPTNRAETILFSTNALITLRNGSYYLSCRIGDMRQVHFVNKQTYGLIGLLLI